MKDSPAGGATWWPHRQERPIDGDRPFETAEAVSEAARQSVALIRNSAASADTHVCDYFVHPRIKESLQEWYAAGKGRFDEASQKRRITNTLRAIPTGVGKAAFQSRKSRLAAVVKARGGPIGR